MDTCFLSTLIKSVFPEARIPRRSPGTLIDVDSFKVLLLLGKIQIFAGDEINNAIFGIKYGTGAIHPALKIVHQSQSISWVC